jgi:hypothetical protein
VGLQEFERRLERLVEGTFNKAFRTGLQPVEIGHRVIRVLDDKRTVGVKGRLVAPNNLGVYLSTADFDRFRSFAEPLARELADAAREHARDERYTFLGPVTVTLVPDDTLRVGDLDVVAEIAEGAGGHAGSLVLPEGRRLLLGEETVTIGRLPECTVTITDPRASRHHAEVRPSGNGYVVVDLGSTNGTSLNGAAVGAGPGRVLEDGDEITVGATTIRFEAS